MDAVDLLVLGRGRAGKFQRVEARDEIAGGHDGIDRLLALRQVPRVAHQLDGEDEGCGVHRQRLQVGGLAVDEIVRLEAALDHRDGADAALQLANDIGQQHVAAQLHTIVDQRLQRAEVGGIARLHVRHADAVDELVVDLSAPGIDGPALGHGVGVDMAVEHQALGAAGAAQPADCVDALARNRRQLDLEAQRLHLLRHPRRQHALALGLAVALVLHHPAQEFQAEFGVDTVEQLLRVHREAPTGAGDAASSSRV